MGWLKSNTIVIAVALLLLLFSSFYTVFETQRGLVSILGKIQQDSKGQPRVIGPGLHVTWPLISKVMRFDRRLQTLDISQSRIMTVDKKDVIVDSYVKWQIKNFAQYYIATGGDSQKAELLLQQQVGDGLRAEFGKQSINDVVAGKRQDIMELIRKQVDNSAQSFGITVNDVRIKRIDLPDEVSESVYGRMRASREQGAAQHRAEGARDAEKIRADTDKAVLVMLADADKRAKEIQGEGDALAAQIYNEAYTKNPDFYAFYRSLEAYQGSIQKGDVLVIKPDNQFFKYFNHTGAKG